MSKHTPLFERAGGLGGTQTVYRFPNDYGASVLTGGMAYTKDGTYELGVIRFRSDADDDFGLTYETPITDDVLGYITADEVAETLDKIAALPARVEVAS